MDVFLYTTNLKFEDKGTARRVLDIYNIIHYGHKNRGKAILEKWNGRYMSTSGLLLEYAPHAIKKRLEKFPTTNTLSAGYIYAPYIPLQKNENEPEEWLVESIGKTMKSRYAKVEVSNNFMGTLFPGETPPKSGSYLYDKQLENKEKRKKKSDKISFTKELRSYYDNLGL
jgi:hypothetical protein